MYCSNYVCNVLDNNNVDKSDKDKRVAKAPPTKPFFVCPIEVVTIVHPMRVLSIFNFQTLSLIS